MGTKEIAQWLIENPQAWFQVVDFVAEKNPNYVRQLAAAFDDVAYEIEEKENLEKYGDFLRDIDDPGEQQEWRDFDPDC